MFVHDLMMNGVENELSSMFINEKRKRKHSICCLIYFNSYILLKKKEEKKKEKEMCSNHNLNFVLKDTQQSKPFC